MKLIKYLIFTNIFKKTDYVRFIKRSASQASQLSDNFQNELVSEKLNDPEVEIKVRLFK